MPMNAAEPVAADYAAKESIFHALFSAEDTRVLLTRFAAGGGPANRKVSLKLLRVFDEHPQGSRENRSYFRPINLSDVSGQDVHHGAMSDTIKCQPQLLVIFRRSSQPLRASPQQKIKIGAHFAYSRQQSGH